jgi:hypothetical protein
MCDLEGISKVVIETIQSNKGLSNFQKEELIVDLAKNLTEFIELKEKEIEKINDKFKEAFQEEKPDFEL